MNKYLIIVSTIQYTQYTIMLYHLFYKQVNISGLVLDEGKHQYINGWLNIINIINVEIKGL